MVHIVLLEPEIPMNTGNIARTCAATGSKLHLIKPLGFDISDSAVKRAGLDYWPLVDLQVYENLDSFFEENGDQNVYLATTKAPKSYAEADFTGDVTLIFGKETAGLPQQLREKYRDRCMRIPMKEDARSLNLANSVAVVCYEALRQQGFPGLVGTGSMKGDAMVNYNKKTVRDADFKGKTVLLRCDFNVPLDVKTRAITSDKRIVASLPTIRYLLDNGAAVIICSHLGKPKGRVKPELSLAPIAWRLADKLGQEIIIAADVNGPDAKAKAAELKPGEVLLLENLRFDEGEEKNDPEFTRELASMADVYVSDAFGAAHRAHASTCGVADYLPAYAGFLLEKELSIMCGALEKPKHPFVAIIGGAKVSDKIGVVTNLMDKADTIIIGGGMAYTFVKAMGGDIGNSLFEEDKVDLALSILDKARLSGVNLLLPVDTVIGDKFSPECNRQTVDIGKIPDGWMGMDIGPKSIAMFTEAIKGAEMIIWNGPMGVFEFPAFAEGTNAVARSLAETEAVTIVGGGDSASAIEHMGYADKMTHISTGGGASLELLEGLELPGIVCLLDKVEETV